MALACISPLHALQHIHKPLSLTPPLRGYTYTSSVGTVCCTLLQVLYTSTSITRHLLFGLNRHRYQSLPIQYAKNQFSIIQRNYNSETLKLLFDFFYGSSEEVGEGLSLARNWKAVVGEHNQLGMDGTEQVLNVVSIHKHRQFFIKGMYPQHDQLIVHMQCDNLTILRFTQNPPI